MRILLVGCSMSGKLIDKKQLPTHQEFSAICLKNPKSGVPIFFIMVGHSFGLVSAVYNYNRRSGAMNEFFVSLLACSLLASIRMASSRSPQRRASARLAAESVHLWLGTKFDRKKLQFDALMILWVIKAAICDWKSGPIAKKRSPARSIMIPSFHRAFWIQAQQASSTGRSVALSSHI